MLILEETIKTDACEGAQDSNIPMDHLVMQESFSIEVKKFSLTHERCDAGTEQPLQKNVKLA